MTSIRTSFTLSVLHVPQVSLILHVGPFAIFKELIQSSVPFTFVKPRDDVREGKTYVKYSKEGRVLFLVQTSTYHENKSKSGRSKHPNVSEKVKHDRDRVR